MNILISSIDGMMITKDRKYYHLNGPVILDNITHISKESQLYQEKEMWVNQYDIVFYLNDHSSFNWKYEDELTRNNRYEEIISYFKKLDNTKII
jgi:hypothetical protein